MPWPLKASSERLLKTRWVGSYPTSLCFIRSSYLFPNTSGSCPYQRFVCFIDPSSSPHVPGWPLRNLLTLLLLRFKVRKIKVIAWKDELGGSSAGESRTRIASIKLGKESDPASKKVVLEGRSLSDRDVCSFSRANLLLLLFTRSTWSAPSITIS